MHNIEKSGFRKGEYVGYGGGHVFRITKSTSSSGSWHARSQSDPNNQLWAFGLKQMSKKLDELGVKSNPSKRKISAARRAQLSMGQSPMLTNSEFNRGYAWQKVMKPKRKISAARRAQLIKQLEKARAMRKKTPKRVRLTKAQHARAAALVTSSGGIYNPRRNSKKKIKHNPVVRRTVKHTPMFKLVVQKGSGPRMHYNGAKFTTNGHYVRFSTQNELLGVSRELMKRFPILKGYKFIGVPVGSK